MSRPWRKVFWLTASSVLLLALIWTFPSLLGRLAEAELLRRGFLQPRVEFADLGLHAATVRRLSLEQRADNRSYRLTARDIFLSYRLPDLFSGRIETIRLPEAELRVETAGATRQPPFPREIEFPPPPAWLPGLPFRQLQLDRLHLHLAKEGDKPLLLEAEGALTRDAQELRARLVVTAAGHPALRAEAVLAPDDRSSLTVAGGADSEKILALTSGPIETAGRRLKTDLDLEFDLGRLQRLVSAWKPSTLPEGLSGNLSAQLHLNLPAAISADIFPAIAATWLEGQGHLRFSLPRIKGLAEAPRGDISFGVTLVNQNLRWRLEKSSRASFYPLWSGLVDQKSVAGELLRRQGKQPIVVTLPAGAAGQFHLEATAPPNLSLQLPGALQLDYGSAASPLQLHLQKVSLGLSLQPAWRLQSEFSFTGALRDPNPVPAGKISGKGRGKLTLKNNRLGLVLLPGSEVSIDDLRHASVTIPAVGLETTSPVSCTLELKNSRWQCRPFGLTATAPTAEVADLAVKTSPGDAQIGTLAGSPESWRLKLRGQFPDWTFRRGEYALKLDRLLADLQVDGEKLSSQVTVQAAGAVEMTAEVTHSLAGGRGQAHLQIQPIDFAEHQDLPNRLVTNWPAALKLDGGRLAAEGEISWQPASADEAGRTLRQSTRIRLQDLSGGYQNVRFEGLATEVSLQGLEPLRVDPAASVHLAALDAGIPLTDIDLNLGISLPQQSRPKLTVSDLHARALGGELTSDRIELDLAQEKNFFTVRLRGLSLEDVLKLEQKEGLQGTGTIDGELPVVLTRTGPSIADGRLTTRAPGGILRYTASERVKSFAATNPNLQLLLRALEDFRYSSLDADLAYAPDGALNMQLKLRGSNPELERGRPVHLNLGVEENILTLLHSLRLGEEISGKIGEKVQQRGSGR